MRKSFQIYAIMRTFKIRINSSKQGICMRKVYGVIYTSHITYFKIEIHYIKKYSPIKIDIVPNKLLIISYYFYQNQITNTQAIANFTMLSIIFANAKKKYISEN